MAIALRGSGTVGPNSNATSTTISLPAGMTQNDVSVICFKTETSRTTSGVLPVLTPAAGWTALYNHNGICIVYRVFQTGDATTGIACSSTISGWWESACVAYSGCDTSAPIDQFIACNQFYENSGSAFPRVIIEAPSVQASYNGGQYVGIFTNGGSSGNTLGTPAGLTSRAATANGPSVKIADLALTDGTPTGPYSASCTAQHVHTQGASLILKASGAAAATLAATRPVLGGFHNAQITGTTYALLLDTLDVQDGDLVLYLFNGIYTVTPPSGYTKVANSVDGSAAAYSHSWATGETLAPSFTFAGSQLRDMYTVLVRRSGSVATNPTIEQTGVNTTTTTGAITVSPPSLTPANAAELLLMFWGNQASAGTFSAQPTLTVFEDPSTTNQGGNIGYVLPGASPTGTYNDTWTRQGGLSDTLSALGILITIAAAATPAVAGGSGALQALQSVGGGLYAAPVSASAPAPSGRAWWGYESFNGPRPWWYGDLKDKAKKLERLRQERIELGILPKPQAKQIAKVVAEVESFVRLMPTPQTADKYIARADALADRLAAVLEQMEEDDDEAAIAGMKGFFFKQKSGRPSMCWMGTGGAPT